MFSLKLYLNSTKCQEEKNVKALPFLKQLYCQNRLTVSHKDLGFFFPALLLCSVLMYIFHQLFIYRHFVTSEQITYSNTNLRIYFVI